MMWFFGFVASYLTARTLNWPLIWGVALVAGLYLLATGGGAGITGAVGDVVGGVTRAVGGVFGFFRRFIVGLVVFLLVGVLLNRFTGVDLGFAAPRFAALGVSVWGWPAHIDMAVLLYLCTMAIAAVVAMQYASGSTRNATLIVLASFVIAFMTIWMPRTAEMVRPKPVARMPATATKWDATDQTMAESGLGPVVVGTVKRAIVGDKILKRTVDYLGDTYHSVFPKSTTTTATTSATTSAPAPVVVTGPTPAIYPFDVTTNCVERDLEVNSQWAPIGGAMRVTDPAGHSHVEKAGEKTPPSAPLAGQWEFCGQLPDAATGVAIWE